jgi:hypothetical protein
MSLHHKIELEKIILKNQKLYTTHLHIYISNNSKLEVIGKSTKQGARNEMQQVLQQSEQESTLLLE